LHRRHLFERSILPARGIPRKRITAEPGKRDQETLKVLGFFLPGGKPSDARLNRTGRVDLIVDLENGAGRPAVSTLWEVNGPV
jgi:hypothetical protein